MSSSTTDWTPLRSFVRTFAALLDQGLDEAAVLSHGTVLLEALVAEGSWLSDNFARPNPEGYRQYLLHCDSAERFSVVSFVWGPGQSTPIHDHRVWGLVGVLRGQEHIERFRRQADGLLASDGAETLDAGAVDAFSPATGDIHRVANGLTDAPSVSIHIYGANIGTVERATYALDGTAKPFVSSYANDRLPNLWQP